MSDIVHFEGDPETDSSRRQMERLLKGEPRPRRRWPWMVTALAGAGLFVVWQQSSRDARERKDKGGASPEEAGGGKVPGSTDK